MTLGGRCIGRVLSYMGSTRQAVQKDSRSSELEVRNYQPADLSEIVEAAIGDLGTALPREDSRWFLLGSSH